MRPGTITARGGYSPEPTTEPVAAPICHTTGHAFDNAQHGADIVVHSLTR